MAIYPQRLTIYLYSAHRAVIFVIAQLSCTNKGHFYTQVTPCLIARFDDGHLTSTTTHYTQSIQNTAALLHRNTATHYRRTSRKLVGNPGCQPVPNQFPTSFQLVRLVGCGLRDLHWLRTRRRVNFSLASLACLHGLAAQRRHHISSNAFYQQKSAILRYLSVFETVRHFQFYFAHRQYSRQAYQSRPRAY